MTRKKEQEIEVNDLEESPEDRQTQGETGDSEEESKKQGAQGNGDDDLSEEDKLRKQLSELEDRLLRTVAEFDNYKKRQARQYEQTVRGAADRVLTDLLDISDNLSRALEHGDNGGDLESLRKGTEMIHNQMKDLLARYDVKPIQALGKPFDPNLHEALMQVESDDYDDGIVAIEISKGYKRGDRVLRHARVGVSTGAAGEDDE